MPHFNGIYIKIYTVADRLSSEVHLWLVKHSSCLLDKSHLLQGKCNGDFLIVPCNRVEPQHHYEPLRPFLKRYEKRDLCELNFSRYVYIFILIIGICQLSNCFYAMTYQSWIYFMASLSFQDSNSHIVTLSDVNYWPRTSVQFVWCSLATLFTCEPGKWWSW